MILYQEQFHPTPHLEISGDISGFHNSNQGCYWAEVKGITHTTTLSAAPILMAKTEKLIWAVGQKTGVRRLNPHHGNQVGNYKGGSGLNQCSGREKGKQGPKGKLCRRL